MVETEPKLRAKLIEGEEWMKRNPDHSGLQDFFNDKWLPLLAIYEDRYGLMTEDGAVKQLLKKEQPLPEPSPWIEELREQLTLGGIADVEPRRERLQS